MLTGGVRVALGGAREQELHTGARGKRAIQGSFHGSMDPVQKQEFIELKALKSCYAKYICFEVWTPMFMSTKSTVVHQKHSWMNGSRNHANVLKSTNVHVHQCVIRQTAPHQQHCPVRVRYGVDSYCAFVGQEHVSNFKTKVVYTVRTQH